MLKKYRAIIGLICFVLMAAVVSVYSFGTLKEIYRYFSYSAKTSALVQTFSVEEVEEDGFAVVAHYTYDVGGKNYENKSPILDIVYRNEWAAKPHIEDLKKIDNWSAWFQPKDPSQATVYKSFPWKSSIYSIIQISVLCYFVAMRSYLKRENE